MPRKPWILVPCLIQLRSEFTTIAPGRDTASDGSVGDLAHEQSVSDHNPDETGRVPIRDADRVNEVHAIDVDKDLRVPGLDMEKVVQFLLARCRAGTEKRLRYIIWNRRIWEASNDWRQRTYTGPNAHDQHAHFSASYESVREASRASWHLADLLLKPKPPKEDPMADLSQNDIDKISTAVADKVLKALTKTTMLKGADGKEDGTFRTEIGHYVLSQGVPNKFNSGKRTPFYELVNDIAENLPEQTPTPQS